MATYINNDGLTVKFGPDDAGSARVAEFSNGGASRTTEIVLDADFLPETGEIILDSYRYYEGSKLVGYEVLPTQEDFAGGTSIEISLVDASDNASNEIVVDTIAIADLNAQGRDDALDLAALGAPKVVKLTTVGTFTAGGGTVALHWTMPKAENDTLVWDKDA